MLLAIHIHVLQLLSLPYMSGTDNQILLTSASMSNMRINKGNYCSWMHGVKFGIKLLLPSRIIVGY